MKVFLNKLYLTDGFEIPIKAYIQTMYVELRVDKFASKYDFDDYEPVDEDELPF